MSEKYAGESLENGEPYSFFVSFHEPIKLVIVSGMSVNPCGHMLLQIGSNYTHIAEAFGYPHVMDQNGFERYMDENEKELYQRIPVRIPNPLKAHRKMVDLLYKQWNWYGLPNNCVHYIEEILNAGGCEFNMISNCPKFILKNRSKKTKRQRIR